MKRIDRERDRIEEEAIAYLRSTLYDGRPDDCPKFLHFSITARDKRRWPKEYQKGISCFKALFATGEEGHRLALWNMLVNYCAPDATFCKRDFSDEEYTFLQTAMKADWAPIEANVNRPIVTERLLLRPIEREDQKILAEHFKNDGDFVLFTGSEPTNKNLREFTIPLRRYTYFAIERRADKKLLGYIGLSIKWESATGLIEYYLFKEERRKGYCKEAVGALTKVTLKGKLYMPVETVQFGVYGKKVIRLNAIRARISSDNTASQRTVESCGFVHEATIHQTLHKGSAGWTDEEIYYLTSEM